MCDLGIAEKSDYIFSFVSFSDIRHIRIRMMRVAI